MLKLPLFTRTKVKEKTITLGYPYSVLLVKFFPQSFFNCLQQLAEDICSGSQCGFGAQQSTSGMTFAIRQLQEKSHKKKQLLYLAFVDLTKAFNLVDQRLLFTVLAKSACLPSLHALIQSFHNGMQAYAQFIADVSNYFPIRRGVNQDCVLTPTY